MKRFLLACLFAPIMVSAQGDGQYRNSHRDGRGGRGGNSYNNVVGEAGSAFTIFSVSGDRFYLMINGIKQNTYPQQKIRIEYLPQVTNDIQIIFDDNQTPAISKRITFVDPLEGRAVNLVLKLERTREGRPHLEFVKMNSLEKDYRREDGEYVMRYGKDDGRGMYNADDHVNGNPNGGYVGNGGRVTTNGSGPRPSLPPVTPPPPPPPPAPTAMDPTSFADAKKTIAAAAFDDTKMSTAKVIAKDNFFTVDQISQICKLFSFEDNKLAFAKFAFNRCIEQRSYYKIATIFNFSSSKEDLNQFITDNTPH